MKFIIAVILVVLLGFISFITSKGFEDIGILAGYLFGSVILAPSLIAGMFCIPQSGRNSKRFFTVFNIVILISIFTKISPLAELVEKHNKPPTTVSDAKGLIEMTVPASLESIEPPNENVLLIVEDTSLYLKIMVGYEQARTDRIDIAQYAQLMGEKITNSFPDFESISEPKKCESVKLECIYRIVYTSGGKGTATVLASLNGADGYYNFMAITNTGLLERNQGHIFSALSSLTERQQ